MTAAVPSPTTHASSASSPALTLYCLPHAGGHAAAFREWHAALPAWVECVPVDLPGHGRRRFDAPFTDWPALIDALTTALGPLPRRPFALFGHSMGALVALALAHRLRDTQGRAPVWLGVAGCAGPTVRDYDDTWLSSSDETMVAELRRLGGTPDALLAEREFLDLALPALRADFHLCATYADAHRASYEPLDCAVLALGGRADALLDDPASLDAWRHETSGPFDSRVLDGGHFFVDTQRRTLLALIADALHGALRAAPHVATNDAPPALQSVVTDQVS